MQGSCSGKLILMHIYTSKIDKRAFTALFFRIALARLTLRSLWEKRYFIHPNPQGEQGACECITSVLVRDLPVPLAF